MCLCVCVCCWAVNVNQLITFASCLQLILILLFFFLLPAYLAVCVFVVVSFLLWLSFISLSRIFFSFLYHQKLCIDCLFCVCKSFEAFSTSHLTVFRFILKMLCVRMLVAICMEWLKATVQVRQKKIGKRPNAIELKNKNKPCTHNACVLQMYGMHSRNQSTYKAKPFAEQGEIKYTNIGAVIIVGGVLVIVVNVFGAIVVAAVFYHSISVRFCLDYSKSIYMHSPYDRDGKKCLDYKC